MTQGITGSNSGNTKFFTLTPREIEQSRSNEIDAKKLRAVKKAEKRNAKKTQREKRRKQKEKKRRVRTFPWPFDVLCCFMLFYVVLCCIMMFYVQGFHRW